MSPWAADWASAEETFEFAWLAGELLEPDEPHPASARPAATGIRYLSRLKSGMAMRPSCDVPPEFLLKGQVVGWSPAMVFAEPHRSVGPRRELFVLGRR